MEVKFLPESYIEREAEALLAAYGARFNPIVQPPIPVDEIVDCHLELLLELGDLCAEFKSPDVLGALWVEDKRVVIDQSLDPHSNHQLEGRYRFTLAHEAGHWVLHRQQLIASREPGLFHGKTPPSVVCREMKKKPPIEWQADCFAGYLLMPAAMVRSQWTQLTGSAASYVAEAEMRAAVALRGSEDCELPTLPITRQMKDVFRVSAQAMQYRLLKLGLILTTEPPPSLFV